MTILKNIAAFARVPFIFLLIFFCNARRQAIRLLSSRLSLITKTASIDFNAINVNANNNAKSKVKKSFCAEDEWRQLAAVALSDKQFVLLTGHTWNSVKNVSTLYLIRLQFGTVIYN